MGITMNTFISRFITFFKKWLWLNLTPITWWVVLLWTILFWSWVFNLVGLI